MAAPESSVPLSAVGLRLTDQVGQTVLEWVAAGDLALSAALDQHVAAVRVALASCQPTETRAARQAGQAAGWKPRSEATRSEPTSAAATRSEPTRSEATASKARPHRARRVAGRPADAAPAQAPCPDAPFADSAWHADAPPPLRLLLHYACGFVEAAVRADWWPSAGDTAPGAADFAAVRLAAVCRLIRQAETAAAVPPDLR